MTSNSATTTAKKGAFLVIEGVDGIGKSTVVPMVAELLRSRSGRVVSVHREPGGTPVGERIRNILLNQEPGALPLDGGTAAILFSAARRELMEKVVKPAIDRGEIVLLDRFVLSTYVYQGEQGVRDEDIAQLTRQACENIWPDAITVLTLDPKELERRRQLRAQDLGQDQFDAAQTKEVGVRRQRRYVALAQSLPNGIVVDVGDTPERNALKIVEAITNCVPSLGRVSRSIPR